MTLDHSALNGPTPRISAQPIAPINPTAKVYLVEMTMKPVRLSVIGSGAASASAPTELRLLDEVLAWLSLPNNSFRGLVCLRWRATFLCDPASLSTAYQLFARFPMHVSRLRIAVDEEDVVLQREYVLPPLRRLSEDGLGLLLDDFGGGLSSMALYQEGLFSAVRLPPRWSARAGEQPQDDAIAQNLLNLAADLGMRTIADGARDPQALQALVDMGVDYVQGLAVAPAMPLSGLVTGSTPWQWVSDEAMRQALQGTPRQSGGYSAA